MCGKRKGTGRHVATCYHWETRNVLKICNQKTRHSYFALACKYSANVKVNRNKTREDTRLTLNKICTHSSNDKLSKMECKLPP